MVTSRHIEREKALLPVDLCCSKTPLLKLYLTTAARVDCEQSLFLVRRAKRPRHANDHARDWRRETGEARRPRFSRLAASPLNAQAHALPILNLKKKRDCSQSTARVAQLVEPLIAEREVMDSIPWPNQYQGVKTTEKRRYCLFPANDKTFTWLLWTRTMTVPSPDGHLKNSTFVLDTLIHR